MPKIYKCLQCSEEFPSRDGQPHLFHERACYTLFLQSHGGTAGIKDLSPIFVRNDPKKGRGRKPQHIAKNIEQVAPPEPISDEIIEVPENNVIDFDDLSINDLKSVVAQLLEENDRRQVEIDHLTEDLRRKEQAISPLKEIVDGFVQKVKDLYEPAQEHIEIPVSGIEYLQRKCAGLGCQNMVKQDDTFCSQTCAKSVIPPHGVMRMESDGRLIS